MPYLPLIVSELLPGWVLFGLPTAIGIAVLRYHLYDIDLIINRTLVYGSLSVMLVATYLGGVVGLQYVFRGLTGQESQLAIVASTLAIAALFVPLRRRVQGLVRSALLPQEVRRHEDPRRLLRQAARRDAAGRPERGPGRGGHDNRAAGPRLLVAAPRTGSQGRAS
jgi:hypothetical protein